MRFGSDIFAKTLSDGPTKRTTIALLYSLSCLATRWIYRITSSDSEVVTKQVHISGAALGPVDWTAIRRKMGYWRNVGFGILSLDRIG